MKPEKPKIEMSETQLGRVIGEATAKIEQARRPTPVERISTNMKAINEQPKVSRKIEDWLALAGVGQAMLYGLAEFLIHMGIVKGSDRIPWMTMALFLGCVLPKTVGRATAGKVWEAIANRFGRKEP